MKIETKYGLIAGLGICAWTMMEYLIGFHTDLEKMDMGQYSGYFSAIIPIVAFTLGIRCKKHTDFNGTLTFKQGIRAGLVITLITAAIISVFFLIYYTLINSDWMTIGYKFEKNKLINEGLSDGQIAEHLTQFKEMYSLPAIVSGAFFGTIVQGGLLTLIITLILRTKEK